MTDAEGRGARPRSLDVAVGLVSAAAVATVLLGIALPLQVAPTVEQQGDAAALQGVTREQLAEQLTAFATAGLVIAVLFAAALGLTAWRLRRGSGAARIWLVVLTVLSIAPLNLQALLVAVVLVVASLLTFRSTVSDWIRSRRP